MRDLPYSYKEVTDEVVSLVVGREKYIKADPAGGMMYRAFRNIFAGARAEWLWMRQTTEGFVKRIDPDLLTTYYPRFDCSNRGATTGRRPSYLEPTGAMKDG